MSARLRAAALAVGLILVWATAVVAQDAPEPDYDSWDQFADAAAAQVDRDGTPEATLEALRQELSTRRATFLDAQQINADAIDRVRAQIDALPAPPAEGANEPAEFDQRRQELNDRLATLRAPQFRAEEAYNRADALIGDIDTELRERQTEALLALQPSPLMPTQWGAAVTALRTAVDEVGGGIRRAGATPESRAEIRDRAPLILLLSVVGLTLLLRGRLWTQTLTDRVEAGEDSAGREALVFLVSLSQIVLPVAGVAALVQAAGFTGIINAAGLAVLRSLPIALLAFYGSRWIGERFFPRQGLGSRAPLPMERRERSLGRRYASALGTLHALQVILGAVAEAVDIAPSAMAVIKFPVLAATGVFVFWMARLIIRNAPTWTPDDEEDATARPTYIGRLIILAGRAMLAVAIGGPILAAIGYYVLAEALLMPTIETLAVVATLGVLHQVIRDIYALTSRRSQEEAVNALTPILVSFVLALLAVPLIALIWHARPADLLEIWAGFRAGFTIGDTRISPGVFFTIALVFAIGYGLTRVLQGALQNTILPRTRLSIGGRNAVTSGLGYVGVILAALVAITAAGLDLSSLAIVAGALSVGIGFGLQTIVQNFVSGIILLIERPISQGDWIEVGGQMGIVRDISVRSTRIETFDRTDVIVPNGDFISGTVTNWTRGNLTGRVTIHVGAGYGADSQHVQRVLEEVCRDHPLVAMTPPPAIYFMKFGADSLEFVCYCVLRDVFHLLRVTSELHHAIHARFRQEGIEIPFAQRDVWLRNPEALSPRPASHREPEQAGREGRADPDFVRDAAVETQEQAGDLDAD